MTRPESPIGVFDSGVGGLSILRALRAELPNEDFVYVADAGFAPYGERGEAYVVGRTWAIARELLENDGVKALVVACNTATAAAIHLVRAAHPDLPLVGVEPALKPAAASTRTGRIAVIATRGTVNSAKLAALRNALGQDVEFILQPCDGLADAIHHGDDAKTAALCEQYLRPLGPFGRAPGQIDTVVLGCTHYPFAEAAIRACVGPEVDIIETGAPVARQTRRLLEARGLLRDAGHTGSVVLRSTGPQAEIDAAAARWLGVAA
jgi:glutamate racemase